MRPFAPTDALTVAEIDHATRPGMPKKAEQWEAYLAEINRLGGISLVLESSGRLVGFITTPPVPGLPNYNSITGAVLPEFQRQGLGSELLRTALRQLKFSRGGPRRVVARFNQDDDGLIAFFESNGFRLQHRDLHMRLENLDHIPPIEIPPGLWRRPFKRDFDEELFAHYHTLAFSDQPRFQPYSVEDVKAEQSATFQDDDIFLLETEQGEPVGFVWAILHGESVQIEPLGVSPKWRGNGLGRLLLYLGLQHGRERGATCAELWTGEDNVVSLNLYRQIGFKVVGGYAIYYIDIG